MVAHLRWHSRPGPAVTGSTHTVMVVAFSGWNDAADAASGALEHLWESWRAQLFASIAPDDFVDFTTSRPRARIEGGVPVELHWPRTELAWCTPTKSLSVVLVRGPEVQFRWEQYCAELIDAAEELGCSTVIALGALLSEVPHTRPVPVFATAHEAHILEALDVPASNYEGPVGLPAVLQDIGHRRGLETLGLWAALPGYAAGVPSPLGMVALLEHLGDALGVEVSPGALEVAAATYTEQLDELVGSDEETAAYLVRLEAAYDNDDVVLGTAEALVAEVEDFLRDQP